MLSKRNRIKKAEFDGVFASGKRFNSRNFTFMAMRPPEHRASAFSVSVPKKHYKSAVDRNKIRRRCYSALDKLVPELRRGLWGVFVVRKGIDAVPSALLREEISDALSRAEQE